MAHPSPLPPAAPAAPPRKRGGQPRNQNARKQGSFSMHQPGPRAALHIQLKNLSHSFRLGQVHPQTVLAQTEPYITQHESPMDLAAHRFLLKVIRLRLRARNALLPAILQHRALQQLVRDPLGWLLSIFQFSGIERDVDSFFPVSKKSARNSPHPPLFAPLPPDHPNYATNLTDEQWALIEPLIPPDPHSNWLHGQPPLIIAANRWGFSRYQPGSEFNDFLILEQHDQVASRYPALQVIPGQSRSKRGRPKDQRCPRAMLDAILWKLATAHNWDDLPSDFPPMRLCRKYYRRLFLSGRLYTILLALYNHLRLEQAVDIDELYEQGTFTTTPSQNIALHPNAPLDTRTCTALLFMQLAREAYSRSQREQKKENPFHPNLPVFKGLHPLTTAWLPPVASPTPAFEPLETSLAWFRMQHNEKQQKIIDREVRRIVAERSKQKKSAKENPP